MAQRVQERSNPRSYTRPPTMLIVEGLTKLFEEIRVKESLSELRPEYQKVAEWAKIEYLF